jgi:hypothetical protein
MLRVSGLDRKALRRMHREQDLLRTSKASPCHSCDQQNSVDFRTSNPETSLSFATKDLRQNTSYFGDRTLDYLRELPSLCSKISTPDFRRRSRPGSCHSNVEERDSTAAPGSRLPFCRAPRYGQNLHGPHFGQGRELHPWPDRQPVRSL